MPEDDNRISAVNMFKSTNVYELKENNSNEAKNKFTNSIFTAAHNGRTEP